MSCGTATRSASCLCTLATAPVAGGAALELGESWRPKAGKSEAGAAISPQNRSSRGTGGQALKIELRSVPPMVLAPPWNLRMPDRAIRLSGIRPRRREDTPTGRLLTTGFGGRKAGTLV